jgi:hypothetical protein
MEVVTHQTSRVNLAVGFLAGSAQGSQRQDTIFIIIEDRSDAGLGSSRDQPLQDIPLWVFEPSCDSEPAPPGGISTTHVTDDLRALEKLCSDPATELVFSSLCLATSATLA